MNDCTNGVFEPIAIITVAIGVVHTSATVDMILTPPAKVMSSIWTAEFTMATPLDKNNIQMNNTFFKRRILS